MVRTLAFEFKTKMKMKMKEKHGHRLHLNFLENKHKQENKYENYFKSSTRRTTKLTCCANLEINNKCNKGNIGTETIDCSGGRRCSAGLIALLRALP